MSASFTLHRTESSCGRAEGRFMHFVRLIGERLARPRFLYPGELSPHLLRDIGLLDDRMAGHRSRP